MYMCMHSLISDIAISFIPGYFLIVSLSIVLLDFFSVVLSGSASLPLHHCIHTLKKRLRLSLALYSHTITLYLIPSSKTNSTTGSTSAHTGNHDDIIIGIYTDWTYKYVHVHTMHRAPIITCTCTIILSQLINILLMGWQIKPHQIKERGWLPPFTLCLKPLNTIYWYAIMRTTCGLVNLPNETKENSKGCLQLIHWLPVLFSKGLVVEQR